MTEGGVPMNRHAAVVPHVQESLEERARAAENDRDALAGRVAKLEQQMGRLAALLGA